MSEREWIIEEMNRLERQLQQQIAELRDELLASAKRSERYAESLIEAYAKVSAVPVPQSLRA